MLYAMNHEESLTNDQNVLQIEFYLPTISGSHMHSILVKEYQPRQQLFHKVVKYYHVQGLYSRAQYYMATINI